MTIVATHQPLAYVAQLRYTFSHEQNLAGKRPMAQPANNPKGQIREFAQMGMMATPKPAGVVARGRSMNKKRTTGKRRGR